jgi:hypothetical protein
VEPPPAEEVSDTTVTNEESEDAEA